MDARNRADGRVMRCRVVVVDSGADELICFREFLFAAVHCVVSKPVFSIALIRTTTAIASAN